MMYAVDGSLPSENSADETASDINLAFVGGESAKSTDAFIPNISLVSPFRARQLRSDKTPAPTVQSSTENPRIIPLWGMSPNENSSSVTEYLDQLENFLSAIFNKGKEEVFEDGIESNFSRSLKGFIERYRHYAVEALAYFLADRTLNPEIASEAMRIIGDLQDQSTHYLRRWILIQGLFSEHARIRDGALIGLASMDDYRTIPDIEKATKNESVTLLRTEMQNVIKQLRKTHLESLS